jgi:hypothetical protein
MQVETIFAFFVGDENHKETALASLAETPGRSGKMIVT